MRNAVLVGVMACLHVAVVNSAPALVVDMDPSGSGVQNRLVHTQTGNTIAVDIVALEMENVFSYQYSIQFDTAKFTYLGCDKDYGISGTGNLLTTNGGVVQGLCQPQQNPPQPGVVEFAHTITGQDDETAASGDGLAGVVYFTANVAPGDSAVVTVGSGYCAPLGGPLNAIQDYSAGVYVVDRPVGTTRRSVAPTPGSIRSGIEATVDKTGTIRCTFPSSVSRAQVELYDAKGNRVAYRRDIAVNGGMTVVSLEALTWTSKVPSGVHLCRIHANGMSAGVALYNPMHIGSHTR